MGGTGSTYGKEERDRIWWTNLKERDHLEELDLCGGIILNSLQ
jgi:hypothetical protein